MTKEEILNMEPGLELDRLVAEWVMGWKEEHIEDDRWHINANFWCRGNEIGPQVQKWSPSTDIAAAMKVVQKLLEKGFRVSMYSPWKGQSNSSAIPEWTVYILGNQGFHTEADGRTLPLAICRAALLAIKEEEENE